MSRVDSVHINWNCSSQDAVQQPDRTSFHYMSSMNGTSYLKKSSMHRPSINSFKNRLDSTGEIWAFSAERLYSPSTSTIKWNRRSEQEKRYKRVWSNFSPWEVKVSKRRTSRNSCRWLFLYGNYCLYKLTTYPSPSTCISVFYFMNQSCIPTVCILQLKYSVIFWTICTFLRCVIYYLHYFCV